MDAFDPAVAASERALDVSADRFLQRRERIGAGRRLLAGRPPAECAFDVEAATFAQDRSALDHRGELADVARPVILLQQPDLHRGEVERPGTEPPPGAI